uniref:Uncharacterized protein n=1 Tax=Monopterus albus TaxID=43700 RepID=A0A3Q3KK38_MONAL|nr:cyclic GMP-AMP synthase-like [Monopterus albus]
MNAFLLNSAHSCHCTIMTGRGKPHKAKTPETKCAKNKTRPEEVKQVSVPRCPGKDFTQEKPHATKKEPKPKERELKKPSHTEDKPSAQSTKTPRRPQDVTKDSLKTTKAKKCGGKEESPEQIAKMTKLHTETTKDTTKASTKTGKAKTCGSKAKSPDRLTKETTKKQPQTPKQHTKASVPQAEVGTILYSTLEKLKIKKNDKSNASEVINEIKKNIIKHLKENTVCFTEVEAPLCTGSYYENVKISNPDEFDVMLAMPVDRVNIEPFGDNGAFYSVELKRGRSPLKKFENTSTLSACKMLDEFREEVKKCVKAFPEWQLTKKKRGCPAVTLTTEVQSVTISLDFVLSLVVKSSWPPFTDNGLKIESWLGTKVRQDYKRKPYYLVPKYEGRGTVENDGVLAKDAWRVSFSHIEKAILKNHGSEKTCCERDGDRCCRKDCLKLLKHLLSLLKEREPSFDKFCSYHAKTTLLHACCSRIKDSEWKASNLSRCFQLLLEDFVGYLKKGELPNFFIPTQNLLSGFDQRKRYSLANCIMEQCDKGFPIFH